MVFKFKVFDFWFIKNGFLFKMKKFCLDSGQKMASAHMGQKESFWKWFRVIEETIFVYKVKKSIHIPMPGICERGFMLMFKKIGILGALSELLEPHLFGRTGALKFGTIGVHHRSFERMEVSSNLEHFYTYWNRRKKGSWNLLFPLL